jgi:Polyketide cyclase / dehydrase and lipid transport
VAILELTQTINRPANEVSDVVIRCGDFAAWNPTIRASRQISSGEIGTGSMFEWDPKGFGSVAQELQEFERNQRVRIVPHSKTIGGGHRFILTSAGGQTRVDHQLEMIPKGIFKVMSPMMTRVARKNLATTANALKRHVEGGGSSTHRSTEAS